MRTLYIYMRALYIYMRALYIYMRALYIYTRALYIYTRALYIYMRALYIYMRSTVPSKPRELSPFSPWIPSSCRPRERRGPGTAQGVPERVPVASLHIWYPAASCRCCRLCLDSPCLELCWLQLHRKPEKRAPQKEYLKGR